MNKDLAKQIHDYLLDEGGYNVTLEKYSEDDGSLNIVTIWIYDKIYEARVIGRIQLVDNYWVMYVILQEDIDEMDDLAEALMEIFGIEMDVEIENFDPATPAPARSIPIKLIVISVILTAIIAVPVLIALKP